jgi:HPt (histidine-containing phosphotransfer) domain-containing protein
VIQNLLENAIKFTETGSIEVSVTTAPDLNAATAIQFTVRDTGIGIPREKLPVIFQPFVQAHDWSSRRYGGTGLGLSIVSHIVTLLGGRIWVESEPSKGSVFSFVIPVQAQWEEITSEVESGDGFDWKSALAIAGGDVALLKELAGLFLQEYPKLIGDLRAAVVERDPKKLDTSAHALKGAVANFGAKAAVEAALWLESKGRAGETEGVDKALASLEHTLAPLLVELVALSNS